MMSSTAAVHTEAPSPTPFIRRSAEPPSRSYAVLPPEDAIDGTDDDGPVRRLTWQGMPRADYRPSCYRLQLCLAIVLLMGIALALRFVIFEPD